MAPFVFLCVCFYVCVRMHAERGFETLEERANMKVMLV